MKNQKQKPGWIRPSLHPTMYDEELEFILDAIEQIALIGADWATDYSYDKHTNEFTHKHELTHKDDLVKSWLKL